jgi:hypothetical protein
MPVLRAEVVQTLPHVVSHQSVVEYVSRQGIAVGVYQSDLAETVVHLTGGAGREVFGVGIRPDVADGAGNVYGAGGAGGN